jgi:hypothetical protein
MKRRGTTTQGAVVTGRSRKSKKNDNAFDGVNIVRGRPEQALAGRTGKQTSPLVREKGELGWSTA